MQPKKQTAATLAEHMRTACVPQGEVAAAGQGRTVSRLLAAFAEAADRDGGFYRARAETALCLLTPGVVQRDPGGLREAITLLLGLGPFGRAQTLRLLAAAPYPPPQLVPILEAVPDREKLHLLNVLCLAGAEAAPGLHEFGLSGAARCDEFELTAIIAFLADLDEEGEALSWPIKKTLRSGAYASWAALTLPGEAEMAVDRRVLAGLRLVGPPKVLGSLLDVAGDGLWSTGLLELAKSLPSSLDDPAVRKALVGLLAAGNETLAPAALDVLEGLGWDKLGEAAARLFLRQPSLRRGLAFRMLLLGEKALTDFLAQFEEGERAKVVLYLFLSLARLTPEFCRACLGRRELGMAQDMTQPEAAQMDAYLLSQERRGPFPHLAQTMGKPVPPQRIEEQGGGFLSRIFGRDKTDLHQAVSQNRVVSRLQTDGAALAEASLSERGFRECRLRGCRLDTVHFENSAFVETDFSGAVMRTSVFTKCTFAGVSFRGAWLHECSFTACEFKGCDFTEAVFHGVKLRDAAFRNCHLGSATFFGAKLQAVRFIVSQLADARLHRVQVRSCAFEGCCLDALKALESAFAGTAFTDCSFTAGWFESSSLFACPVTGCGPAGTRVVRCKTDEPGFIAAAGETLKSAADLLAGNGEQESPPAGLFSAPGRRFMENVLGFWSRHRDMGRLESAMLAANARRLERSHRAMEPEQAVFMRLLPLLLHTDAFEKSLGFAETKPCLVDGFVPTLAQLSLLRKFFPGTATPARSASGCLRIIGLYSIGSIGTLAQAERSDLDCWVCVDGDEAARAWLRLKLDRLEKWAEERFGLETHFFLMTIADVRENRFGLSDEESSGSAQALLLKDEFYRTCLRLAGRIPVWWIMPPGISEAEYRARLPQALRFPLLEPNRSVDLGPLEDIPREEFFGACLWQIVKAIKSPFKSIMKFGLLEVYARSEEDGGRKLLCERLKENLFRGRYAARETDPYLVLFERIRAYYKGLRNHEALYLLREAFLQRFAADRARTRAAAAVHEGFAEILDMLPQTDDPGPMPAQDPSAWSFSKSSRMGALISKFLMDSYGRIRESLVAGEVRQASRITPEDMTKLGRRIMAMFARRENKVERLPFFKLAKRAFRELHFSAEKSPGRRPRWVIKGKPYAAGDVWETLRASEDPGALFVWLVANGLYSEKVPVHGDATIAPFSHEDVVGVLQALKAFFPKTGLTASTAQYLEEETVVRAFFISNLTAPRDAKELREVWTVYLTNWGELFCVADPQPDATLRKSAASYLAKRLDKRVMPLLDMESWQPKRSSCPRIILA